jgi:predicted nucleic acid-binding protein
MNAGELQPAFLDTNILVYALAADDPAKAAVAERLLKSLRETGALRTSVQVLQELYVTLTRKGQQPLTPKQALRYLDWLSASPVFETDYTAVREAAELSAAQRLSYWDALVVAATARSGAGLLYTEDLQHGRVLRGVRIVNPFLRA